MKVNAEHLKQILKTVVATEQTEYDCKECYEQIEKFVELEISGQPPEKAMPMVKHHLKVCGDCREEYQILLKALRQMSDN